MGGCLDSDQLAADSNSVAPILENHCQTLQPSDIQRLGSGEVGSLQNSPDCQPMPNNALICSGFRQGTAKKIDVPPEDLNTLAKLWDKLPEAVRAGFIATAQALAKDQP